MRKRLAMLLALSVTAILTFGVMGSAATFSFAGAAVQPVDIGTWGIALDSSTPGATVVGNTITCPTAVVTASSGFNAAPDVISCNIKATATGTIPVRNFSVFMTATTPDGAPLGKFAVLTPSNPSGVTLAGGLNPIALFTSMPVNLDLPLVWGFGAPAYDDLVNVDLGTHIVITYTLTSAQ